MSIQITVDPSDLSQKQLEAVAGFLLAYPRNEAVHPEIAALVRDASPQLSGDVAPFTVDVQALTTAQEASTAISTAPTAPVIPAPPAVSAAVVAAPPTGNPVLDANGLPWDARIHAESKAQIADGTWRKKRNVDPALVATVEAELRTVMAAPAALPASDLGAWPFVAHEPVAPPAIEPAAAPPAPAPVLAPPPIEPAVAPAATGGTVADFVALVGRASAAIQGGKVSQAEVNQICINAGVPALVLLAQRLDLVPSIAAQVDALIASRP